MPVNADVPDIQTIIVANDKPTSSPLGAKGIGELPMVGVAAAVANAVYHATGVRVREVPIRIEDLLVWGTACKRRRSHYANLHGVS